MSIYYNDNDGNVCAWLRELIYINALPNGIVDERSIADISIEDLNDYGQCHFFAGIGGWAHALELAGWSAARPVWTASLPCQPFSVAGKRKGHEDERHLWPVFYDLVCECRPPAIFGEQVAGHDGAAWFAAVRDDLEQIGYACGAVALTAAGIGAPHIRQRLYWVAYDRGQRQPQRAQRDGGQEQCGEQAPLRIDFVRCGDTDGTAYSDRDGLDRSGKARGDESADGCGAGGPGWDEVVYVSCADGKARPLPQSGIEPLVDGLPDDLVRGGDQRLAPERTAEARTMRLKGYGNAIVPPLAAEFVKTVMEKL